MSPQRAICDPDCAMPPRASVVEAGIDDPDDQIPDGSYDDGPEVEKHDEEEQRSDAATLEQLPEAQRGVSGKDQTQRARAVERWHRDQVEDEEDRVQHQQDAEESPQVLREGRRGHHQERARDALRGFERSEREPDLEPDET